MAVDMFLKFEGNSVPGEARDKVHTNEIDVLSWSWGLSQSGTTHMGGGSGAGKVNVQDLSCVKFVDKATTKLMLACSNGKHYKDATLVVRKAGEKPLEYLTIKMTDVIISSYSTGGSGGEDRLTESISLNFGKVEVKYVPQKADGAGDTPLNYGWDIAGNEAV